MGPPPLLLSPVRDGAAHVLSLGPATPEWPGGELVALAKDRARRGGAAVLRLQDASYLTGPPHVSLAIVSLFRHGRTWYERHGFSVVAGAEEMARCRAAVRALGRAGSYRRLCSGLRAQRDALESMDESWRVHGGTVRGVLWHRRRAIAALSRSPARSVSQAVAAMTCADAAAFTRALVGSREAMLPAVPAVGDALTPYHDQFMVLRTLWAEPRRFVWEAKL